MGVSHIRMTGVVSSERLTRANRCSLTGLKKKPQGRKYQDRSYRNYESRCSGKRGPTLKGRAMYDKWDRIANKISVQ